MKIVLPVHHFPPRYAAGAELYTFRLARWLRSHGHEPEVVCIESVDEGPAGKLAAAFDVYEEIPVWRLSFNLWKADDWAHWSYNHPLLRRWFSEYVKRTRPDVMHFQAGYLIGVAPLEVASEAGVPIVLTLHDYWFVCPRITLLRGDGSLCADIPTDPAGCAWCQCLTSRRFRLADQLSGGAMGVLSRHSWLGSRAAGIAGRRASLHDALSLPAMIIAPSAFLAERFAEHVPSDRINVSRYGIDLERFLGRSRHAPAGRLQIGYLGQIAPHKGIHLLIEAFRALRITDDAVVLHIYGGLEAQPDYVAHLRTISRGDARIHFHGRFDNADVASLLAGLDITVVPSVWYENSPLAIMESQAAGVPVITAALGGMAELVRGGVDGLHFRAGDAIDLQGQLQRIVDEPALLQQLRAHVMPPRSLDDEMAYLLGVYEGVSKRALCAKAV